MKRLLLVFVLFAAAPLFAQQGDGLEKGFAADKVYDFTGVDSVNTFNGNLNLTIPLGGSYPVNGPFSYSLTLYYNSKVWDFEYVGGVPRAVPSRRTNAGMGWLLSLGRLISPTNVTNELGQWVYESPDGGEHIFYDKLHKDDSATPAAAPVIAVRYTRDGSYLRMLEKNDGTIDLEFPDGRIHVFQTSTGLLQTMKDRTHNSMTITYLANPTGTPCPAGGANVWKLTDSKGARTNYVCFRTPGTPSSINPSIVERVILAAPTSITGVTQTATYVFNHTYSTVTRGCFSQVPGDSATIANVPMLTSLTMPDASSYTFQYNLSDAGISECWRGTLKNVLLPTGANIAYTYRNYLVPNEGCSRQTFNSRIVGVHTRTISGPRLTQGRWTYESFLSGAPPGKVECEVNDATVLVDPPAEEMMVRVTDPLNHVTEHYYSIWPGVFGFASPNGFSEWEYGLPFTRFVSTPSVMNAGTNAYLSQRVYSAAGFAASPKIPLRSTYVTYERDIVLPCAESTVRCSDSNARANREITMYHDDGNRVVERVATAFDGLGHYRRSTLGGTASGTSETWIAYNVRDPNVNPTGGIHTADYTPGAAFTPPATWTAWVLNTSSSTVLTEGTSTVTTQTCFGPGSGQLRATRNVASGFLGGQASNVVTVWQHDNNGNVTSEVRLGATNANAPVSPLCTIAAMTTLPTPNITIDHTYSWGVRATSRHAGSTFFTLDQTIDRSTGVVRASRDTAGLTTTYGYDNAFRIMSIQPPGQATTSYTYTRSTGTSVSTFVPARVKSSSTATGLGTRETEFQYDAMGRLWRLKTLMPDATWSVRETLYDAAGNVASRSEQQKLVVITSEYDFSPSKKTIFSGYDALGKPASSTLPDLKLVTYQYKGEREVSTFVTIAGTAGEVSTKTTEGYDRQGRLTALVEANGSPASLTTTYVYDAAGRLTNVSMPGAAGTQTRRFIYDYRGFLTQERHPEVGTAGNGSIDYLNYDAAGKPHRIRTGPVLGPFDLAYDYDVAGRVTQVQLVATAQPLKLFAYDDPTGATYPECAGNRCNGKLAAAARFHYTADFGTVAVTEAYQYDPSTGMMSRRDTTVGSGTGFTGESFNTAQTYNAFGDVNLIHYPCRTAPGGCNTNEPAPPTISHGYTNGKLTSLGTWASSITYAPNGLIDTVTHGSGSTAVREKWVPDTSGMVRPCGIFIYGPGATLTADATAPCGQRLGGTGAQWASGMYAYDGAGNIKQIGGNTYAYDGFNRLTNWTVNGFANARAYDVWGNPVAAGLVVNGTTNRYTHMTYDVTGNVTSDGTRTYTYDSHSMISGTNVGSRAFRFLYTPDNQRVAAIERINVGGVLRNKTTFTLRGMNNSLLRVFVSDETSGTPVWSWKENVIWRGGAVLADQTSAGIRHYGLDHLGSPRLITSATGALIGTQDFAPFGAGGTSNGGAIQFTGHERDAANLAGGSADLPDYMHARYYDASIGRFLAVDPMLDSESALRRPQTWNRYSYVANNPMNAVDPTGAILKSLSGQQTILDIAGTAAEKLKFRQDGSLDISGLSNEDLAGNEGAQLLVQMALSTNTFTYEESKSAQTAGGTQPVDGVMNLDDNPTDAVGKAGPVAKSPKRFPVQGVNGAVTIDPAVQFVDKATRVEIPKRAIAFHELAESYEKVEFDMLRGGHDGPGAHFNARGREAVLMMQRPYWTELPAGGWLSRK